METSLTVYKASAGSGKTFRLAIDYIKLLLTDPACYKSILAVTFTNKATEEMKMRILSQLYGIWKQLPESNSYLQTICRELGTGEQWASERAGLALTQLLHHYNYFRIETIDSFFQSVLRNLARELDLPPRLNIGLNDQQVMELAVDKLVEDTKTDENLRKWMLRFINESIQDDKSWNIIRQMKEFGRTLFREFYKVESQRVNRCMEDPDFFIAYVDALRTEEAEAQRKLDFYPTRFFQILDEKGMTTDDFSYKQAGPCAPFVKMKAGEYGEEIFGKRAMDAMYDATKWLPKNSRQDTQKRTTVEELILPLMQELFDNRPMLYHQWQSARTTLRHLNQLLLLGSIEAKMRQLNSEANRFLLSDTQALLHSIIQGSDSPFIFEKTGALLEHIMIDEFQDTSSTQWKNFKVLLGECMSHANPYNLIVGDVKQSIYRWRGGDWTLLNNIDGAFGNGFPIRVESLSYNYRSCRRIVEFNNQVFQQIARLEESELAMTDPTGAEELGKAYRDVSQQLPEARGDEGYVEVTLLPKNDDYNERMLELTLDTINRLLDQGVEQSGIAILVRTNKYIPLIAQHLMERNKELEVISDEAFRLDASAAVNVMVKALRWIVCPHDQVTETDLAKFYQTVIVGNRNATQDLLETGARQLLPPGLADGTEQLRELSLPDLTERIYALFHLDQLSEEGAYVSAFHDCLSNFLDGRLTDIEDFLEEWDENYCSKTIQSDNRNGVRIISIHKSKGLEYDNVIIPYCDWQLENLHAGNILWCQPKEMPYSALPLVPVSYNPKLMKGTIYEQDYLREHLQNSVDNLNLLYVAFTRACHRLFVIGKREAANTRSASIEMALPLMTDQLQGAVLTGLENNDDELLFCYGEMEMPRKQSKQEQASANVFCQKSSAERVWIKCHENKAEYRQSNRSKEFLANASIHDEPDEEGQRQGHYIATGLLLHQLLSTIRQKEDLDKAISRMEMEGTLEEGPITAKRIRQIMQRSMNNPQAASWFDGSWRLHNERSIIFIHPETGQLTERVPDRVMEKDGQLVVVDFKFGREQQEYHQQVAEYMQLLRKMGKSQVKGFLWYVYTGKIIEVMG